MKPVGTSPWLTPAAALYGVGVRLRNWLYDRNILSGKSFPIPIICVGNLAVGGTGKTPLVEYLIETLQSEYRIAVVSRGYKRATKGLVHATPQSTAREIGDEPRQILRKYPHITMVVEGNRNRAIEYILTLSEEERPQVILLDDGFQHRATKASLSLLLTDCQHPFMSDRLLPAGRLREPVKGRLRADAVVITRCPKDMSPMDQRIMERNLSLYSNQTVYFSTIQYGQLSPLFPEEAIPQLIQDPHTARVIAIAGIGQPELFFRELSRRFSQVETHTYADHHVFSPREIAQMETWLRSSCDFIIMTEKDAMRLEGGDYKLSPLLRQRIYYLPIQTLFLGRSAERLQELLHTTLRKYYPR